MGGVELCLCSSGFVCGFGLGGCCDDSDLWLLECWWVGLITVVDVIGELVVV